MNSDSNKTGNGKSGPAGTTETKGLDAKANAPAHAAAKAAEHAVSQPGAAQPEMHAPGMGRPALLAAIRGRWSNLADADLKDVKTRDELSAAVKAKYGLTADQAGAQVKEWATDRQQF